MNKTLDTSTLIMELQQNHTKAKQDLKNTLSIYLSALITNHELLEEYFDTLRHDPKLSLSTKKSLDQYLITHKSLQQVTNEIQEKLPILTNMNNTLATLLSKIKLNTSKITPIFSQQSITYLQNEYETSLSLLHDIPLYHIKPTILNVLILSPKNTNIKYKLSTKTDNCPAIYEGITHNKYPYTNGILPQTWCNNSQQPDKITSVLGATYPITYYDISDVYAKSGHIIQSKPLGCISIIDNNKTKWIVIGININDENANKYNDIHDVDISTIINFMKDDGVIGNPQTKLIATKIIRKCHRFWKYMLDAMQN